MRKALQRNAVLPAKTGLAGEHCSPLRCRLPFSAVGDGVLDVPAFGTNAFAARRIRSVLPGGGSLVPSGMIDPYGARAAERSPLRA